MRVRSLKIAIFASFVHCLPNVLHTWPRDSFHVMRPELEHAYIRIIFLESYVRILTTISYVNHIVAWYFRPMHGSSSLDFNHETFTQNRNSFAKSNTPLLSVYLKQIFLRNPVEGLLRRLLTVADFVWKCHAPSRYWCLVVKAFRMDLCPSCWPV